MVGLKIKNQSTPQMTPTETTVILIFKRRSHRIPQRNLKKITINRK